MPLSILSKNDIHTAVRSSALAENTRIAYAKGWQRFQDYCTENGIPPLSATPEQIADFLIHVAMQPSPRSGKLLSMGTVAIYKSAINKQYIEAGPSFANHISHSPCDFQGVDAAAEDPLSPRESTQGVSYQGDAQGV